MTSSQVAAAWLSAPSATPTGSEGAWTDAMDVSALHAPPNVRCAALAVAVRLLACTPVTHTSLPPSSRANALEASVSCCGKIVTSGVQLPANAAPAPPNTQRPKTTPTKPRCSVLMILLPLFLAPSRSCCCGHECGRSGGDVTAEGCVDAQRTERQAAPYSVSRSSVADAEGNACSLRGSSRRRGRSAD